MFGGVAVIMLREVGIEHSCRPAEPVAFSSPKVPSQDLIRTSHPHGSSISLFCLSQGHPIPQFR